MRSTWRLARCCIFAATNCKTVGLTASDCSHAAACCAASIFLVHPSRQHEPSLCPGGCSFSWQARGGQSSRVRMLSSPTTTLHRKFDDSFVTSYHFWRWLKAGVARGSPILATDRELEAEMPIRAAAFGVAVIVKGLCACILVVEKWIRIA